MPLLISASASPTYPKPKKCASFPLVAVCIFMGISFSAQGEDAFGMFGKVKSDGSSMIGVFYDLKQTQKREPTNVNPYSYTAVLDEFISKGWDESVLNRYYRVATALYTSQIFIPMMHAGEAPKAFGAEKTVSPSCWVVHYKAQVSPPETGTYRFVGSADDIIAVAVNGKTQFIFNRPDMPLPTVKWSSPEADGSPAANGFLRVGDWIELNADEVIDLDVLLGERPGGFFNGFLMIEKKGANYPKNAAGRPILPIFQVAPYDTPASKGEDAPPFSKGYPVWKSLQ